ncbi:MAG: 50S ribosomal protein L4 [Deltaproteobacteria bacterium RIFCSPLOWO2_02_FULL_53_8]|nr:MAG: 50S ribosomal protein L4 [Deltaproteobacteria bacterium RIFCSPLOWO2_02_FULL_53_8]
MNLDILNTDGKKVSELALNASVDGAPNSALFYEVVKMQLANRRSGTACTKTKGMVSGGGIKPWKQKGTGRARSGSNRSPVWRHGGTVFGPRPRDYSYNVPKKAVHEALLSALKLRLQEGKVKVYSAIELKEPKTKAAVAFLKTVGIDNGLIVIEGKNSNLELAARNLKDFKVLKAAGINVYDILNYDNLLITKAALEKIGVTA